MIIRKVLAYITQRRRLLVFRHTQFPEAGIQVPGGKVEERESLATAVRREAREETGLQALEIRFYLGTHPCEGTQSGQPIVWMYHHFFHLVLLGEAPDLRLHLERHPSDGSQAPIEFELFWVPLTDDLPELEGCQGAFLHDLRL